MGLGGSSALAVAILRALDHSYGLGLDNERINALAFECEKAAHGTPSGVDNTVATYGAPLRYRRDDDEMLKRMTPEVAPAAETVTPPAPATESALPAVKV